MSDERISRKVKHNFILGDATYQALRWGRRFGQRFGPGVLAILQYRSSEPRAFVYGMFVATHPARRQVQMLDKCIKPEDVKTNQKYDQQNQPRITAVN